ncbi:MAG: hypothetical protein NC903_03275, partial [Candidatus Omnitrophica bacterium]|nr:hypothetical protein [Candidatus Omnitrophota bacterium]
ERVARLAPCLPPLLAETFRLRVLEGLSTREAARRLGVSEEAGAPEEEIVKEKPFPNFSIQGLILTEDLPMAIINNTIVKVGDRLGEAELIKIDKEAVTFLYYGKEYKVSIPRYHLEKKEEKR